jgi:cbb3-type cytochrome oxidase maturation protein
MNIIYFLLPLALGLSTIFVIAFVILAKKGQFEDLQTPAYQVLLDPEPKSEAEIKVESQSLNKSSE